jgi:hypothetical protein
VHGRSALPRWSPKSLPTRWSTDALRRCCTCCGNERGPAPEPLRGSGSGLRKIAPSVTTPFTTSPPCGRPWTFPRVERLVEAERRATALAEMATAVSARPYLRSATPALGPLRTPVFDHVPAYRRVRAAAERLFRGSLMIASDAGEAEQVKSTSRMYEQWVFLQLVAAFRGSGLRTESIHQIVRSAGWQRYTLDLERGARVSFRVPDSDFVVVLRYEPWVFARETARARRESVYRGRTGAASVEPRRVAGGLCAHRTRGPGRRGRLRGRRRRQVQSHPE